MAGEIPQQGEPGKESSGIMIPKERLDEVAAKVKEANARAEAAEARFQAATKEAAKQREADAARLAALELRFAPEPVEPAWEDPAEKALAEVAKLTARLEERDKEAETRAQYGRDGAAISAAIEKAGIEDKRKASGLLATQYGAAKHFGNTAWDPVAAAEAYRKEEKEAAELRARAAIDDADATRSAITGSGSAPAIATGPPPKKPDFHEDNYREKRAAWDAEMERRTIAEFRAGR